MVQDFVVIETIIKTRYRPGFGVTFFETWDERPDGSEYISEISGYIAVIGPDTVLDMGGVPCVKPLGAEFWVPVSNFKETVNDQYGDTHDLRSRWFSTREEAEEHLLYTMKRWEHPEVWESFVVTD